MTKVCRNCKKEYNFCPSCILQRNYLQKFCSIKCKNDFEEKKQTENKKFQETQSQK